jgi:hypothetical protein
LTTAELATTILDATNPQTWTLLGALIALVGGMMVMMFHLMFNYLGAKFEALGARFDSLDARMDRLDRDVQVIAERVFRDDRG